MDEVNYLCAQQKAVYGEHASRVKTCYGFDLTGDNAQQTAVYNSIKIDNASVESRVANRDGIMALYGGLFFVGVFLGLLFIMATVLIIYYKQISEGYDDKERFEIMQKVGMSHAEVKRSIHSQILTVFFMPLITAGVHTAFAFPMVSRILAVLNLTNTGLFMACTAVCFVVFAVLYAIIYGATAKTYYKIVSG